MKTKLKMSSTCKECGNELKFLPPHKTDKKRKKTIVTWICSNGHKTVTEEDIK